MTGVPKTFPIVLLYKKPLKMKLKPLFNSPYSGPGTGVSVPSVLHLGDTGCLLKN